MEKRVVLGWAVCGKKKGAGNQCMTSVCFRRLSGSPVIKGSSRRLKGREKNRLQTRGRQYPFEH